MAHRQLTVIDDLPKFTGNPRMGEDLGTRGVDIKNFLRSLDCHIETNRITDNGAKIRLLNSQIDPHRGDAMALMACYAGRNVTYESICEDFISCYPNFEVSDFKVAARSILSNNLKNPEHDLTRLENQSRAVVDAYLGRDEMRHLRIGAHSVLADPRPIVEVEVEGPVDRQNRPPAQPEPPRVEIPLAEVLQNLLLHLFMSNGLPEPVYKNLAKTTPATSSVKFMATAINHTKKERALSGEIKKKLVENEVLYAVQSENKPTSKDCYNCGKTGHYARDCRLKMQRKHANFAK